MPSASSRWIPLGSVTTDTDTQYLRSLDIPHMDHLMITWRITGMPQAGTIGGDIPMINFNTDLFRNDSFDSYISRPPNWSHYYWDGVSFFPESWYPVLVTSASANSNSYDRFRLMSHIVKSPYICAGVLFVSNLKNKTNQMKSVATSTGAHFLSTNEITNYTTQIWNESFYDVSSQIPTLDNTSLPISCTGMATRPPISFTNFLYPNNEQIGRVTLSTYYDSGTAAGSGFSVFGYNLS